MINILLTGVGGQGTVLAAKVLAQAAANRGWQVRTAETIGMAQRGGSVISHVRIGNNGEEVLAPLITHGTADMIIAFEPAEAARTLPYLSSSGIVITATSIVEPVSASLSSSSYNAKDTLAGIRAALSKVQGAQGVQAREFQQQAAQQPQQQGAKAREFQQQVTQQPQQPQLVIVDDLSITNELGKNRKILNTVLLAAALVQNKIPLTLDDLREAIKSSVKQKFVAMNLEAIDVTALKIASL